MSFNDPFIRGQNTVLGFLQQAGTAIKKVNVASKSWKLSENALEAADGVGGEIRDRLAKVTNYYEGSSDIYMPDMEVMDAYLLSQEADDNNEFPLKQAMSVTFKTPRGNLVYSGQEVVIGPWDFSMSGRADVVMQTLKFRFRFWKKLPVL